MKKIFQRCLKDEHGVTAIEYALIGAGISMAIVLVVVGIGDDLGTLVQGLIDSIATILSDVSGA